jgi:translation initiation factor 1
MIFDEFDPFSSIDVEGARKIHLRVQQRSSKKNITIVEGIPPEERKRIIHDLKTKLGCSGTEKNGGIQFSGDQRKKIADYLVETKIVTCHADISVHGY